MGSLDTPFEQYPEKIQNILIHGTGEKTVDVHYEGQRGKGVYPVAFEGLVRNVERKYRETFSDNMKQEYETFMRVTPCKEFVLPAQRLQNGIGKAFRIHTGLPARNGNRSLVDA